ncbi:MAG: MCE family protein [Solirubrobacterales bacterium]|nr:MCE family protein [Solirubrobacterales bacterium]
MSPKIRNPLRRPGGHKRKTPALLIAAICIIIPLLIIYYAFEQKLPFISSSYTDYAMVSNSVNVMPHSPVRIAGVDVGEVTSVQPAPPNGTKIAFTLQKTALPIHTDATMTIRDRVFLEGGYYLGLEPGSPSAPVAKQGFTIDQQHTNSPVQFYQLLSTFDTNARQNLETLLNTANLAFSPSPGASEANSGAGGLKTAIPTLTPDLKDAAQFSQALTGPNSGDLERLLSSTSDITTTLSNHSTNLNSLVRGLDNSTAALANTDGALDSSVNGLDQTLQVTPATLTALDRSLGPLNTLSNDLGPALQQSPPLLDQLTSETNAVNGVVAPASRGRLVSSLHTLLADLPNTLGQLGTVFPATQAAAGCLSQRVLPLLNEQVKDGKLSTNDPVWKDLVHALPNIAGASSYFDADGPYLKAAAGLGDGSTPQSDLGSLNGSPLSNLLSGKPVDSSSGIAPHWLGDLNASDFRPDVSCTSQPLPKNLGPNPAEADK